LNPPPPLPTCDALAGADVLMAARFQSAAAATGSGGGGAASTDFNIGGVLADYELTVARSNARLDAQRSVRGMAQVCGSVAFSVAVYNARKRPLFATGAQASCTYKVLTLRHYQAV
jgi:hypothetical protein